MVEAPAGGGGDILVVQHVEPEGSAAIGAALHARGLRERVVRIDRGDRVPESLGGARGLIVMGGPMGVYEADRYPHLRGELRLIERAMADEVPVLGVCLGSQLVAAALGARVTRAPGPEIGWREVRLREGAQTDPLWAGCSPVFVPLHWHGDVFELPRGACSLASSEQTEHQAFRFGPRTWGLLFHLEMRRADVEAMAASFQGDLAALGVDRQDVIGPAVARTADMAPLAGHVFGAWADLARSNLLPPAVFVRDPSGLE